MVSNFQPTLLADVLDAVHQLTGHTLSTQFIGQSNIEGYGEIAFVAHQPARDILADDFNIGSLDADGLSFDIDGKSAISLKVCYLLLAKGIDSSSHGLHHLTELLAHGAEIALHFLHQDASALNEFHFLDVHFLQENLLHALDGIALGAVNGRDHQRLKGLLHFDTLLATQGKNNGGDTLSNIHTFFEVFIDKSSIEYREHIQMNAIQRATKVFIQLVCKERREGCQHFSYGHQTLIQGLISSQFIVVHLLAPEAFFIQAHIPVR